MPIPSSITALSTTASSNSPQDTDALGSPPQVAGMFRALSAILRQESENKSWELWGDVPAYVSATSFTVPADATARFVAGRRVKCVDASTLYGSVVSATYSSPNTTVTVTLDSGSLSASLSAVGLGPEVKAYQPATGNVAAWAAKNTTYTAVSGDNLACDTSGGAFTVTLPASPTAGSSRVNFKDYSGTFAANNLTVNPNGANIEGVSGNMSVATNRVSFGLLYIDSTKGWVIV